MAETETSLSLRVLVANEHRLRLKNLEAIVRSLGHDVVARETSPREVATHTHEHEPELAIIGLGDSNDHALALIDQITRESACPVIVVVSSPNPDFVAQAARHGVFACISRDDPNEFRNAITIALARFASFRTLEGAFGRRAHIERAKGILMERHQIDEREAFELIRTEARRRGRKVADLAVALNDSHTLLPDRAPSEADPDDQARRQPEQPENPA